MNIHYIYINRKDKSDVSIPSQVLELKARYCYSDDPHPPEFMFWSYPRLYEEICAYDSELGRLFSLIDPDFAAAMADVGRIFCIFKYGGIYHDAHVYIQDPGFYAFLGNTIQRYGHVFEKHPQESRRYGCRNKNIAGSAGNPFFERVLRRMKKNLQSVDADLRSKSQVRHNMWRVTTMTFLDQILEDHGLDSSPYDIRRVPGVADYCYLWSIKTLPRFYNNGTENHWSNLQKTRPLLDLAAA
jgi:hypothetical protein